MIRRKIVWVIWATASIYALWQAGRLTFEPVISESTVSGHSAGPVSIDVSRTYWIAGFMILIVVVTIYGLLGLALAAREYTVFRFIVGGYTILSLLAISIGALFWPSAWLLLIASLLTIRLPRDDLSGTEQQHYVI